MAVVDLDAAGMIGDALRGFATGYPPRLISRKLGAGFGYAAAVTRRSEAGFLRSTGGGMCILSPATRLPFWCAMACFSPR